MSIINLLYVLYIKLVNEISPFLKTTQKSVALLQKKEKLISFPQHFSHLTTNPNQRNKTKKIMKCDLQFAILK